MKHSLVIQVSKRFPPGGIVTCQKYSLREKVMCFLLGPKRRLTILIPDDTVEEVSINTLNELEVRSNETIRNQQSN